MKKLLTLLVLSLLSVGAYSQNYIGFSKYQVKTQLKSEGHIVHDYVTETGIEGVFIEKTTVSAIYLFNDQNMCYIYIMVILPSLKGEYINRLHENGFVMVGADKYENEKYHADIEAVGEYIAIYVWGK